MTTKTTTLIHKSTMCILRLGLLSTLAAAGPLLAQAAPPNLVRIVRQATERFTDVNAAIAAGYAPAFDCVTGPDMGAMGVHYLNGALVSGGQLNATEPQALSYEPVGNAMKLVGSGVHRSRRKLADGATVGSADTRGSVAAIHRHTEPLRLAGVV